MTFDSLLDAYFAAHPFLAAGSRQQLAIALRSFCRFAGQPAVDALESSSVTAWLARLYQDGRSAETIRRKRSSVLTLWRFAAREGWAPALAPVPAPRPQYHVPVAWTLPEMALLLQAAGELRGWIDGVPAGLFWTALLDLEWDTALRLGTLLALSWDQVHLVHHVLSVPSHQLKGRPGDRIFRLHPETAAVIALTVPPARQYLFPLKSRRSAWRWLRIILDRAALPSDRRHLFHCLRRSAESHAAARVGIEAAAAMVGHSAGVARRSYVDPRICSAPALCEVLPRIR